MPVKKTAIIVGQIGKKSIRTIENKVLFSRYVQDSLSMGRPVTFYNWECPPRRVNTNKGRFFIDYDVDLARIFSGKKIDNYTEFPRVVLLQKEEISMLNFLKSLNFPFRFIKIIADTNAYYITPESIDILGKKKVSEKFKEFKKLIKRWTEQYPIKTEVKLFTEVIKPFKGIYSNVYEDVCKILNKNPETLLSQKVYKEQILRAKNHMGILNKQWLKDFSAKTTATYAAEGVVFALLSKTESFSNCVWLNNHEIDDRTIEITNCYRRKMKIGDLPMVFWGMNI